MRGRRLATSVGLLASSGGADALTIRNDPSGGGDGSSSSSSSARRLSKGGKGGEAPLQMLSAAGPQVQPQHAYGGHTGHHIDAKASKGGAAPAVPQAVSFQPWQPPAVETTQPWYTTAAAATQPWYTTAAAKTGGGWMTADQHAWFPPVTTQAATHPPQKGSSEDSAGWWAAHHPEPKVTTAQHMPDASKTAKHSPHPPPKVWHAPPPKMTYSPPPNKAKSAKAKSAKAKSAKSKGAKGGGMPDDGEWSWYTTTAATAMGDDGWSWMAGTPVPGEHTPTVQPTPCGKAGKECEEEVEIPTTEPTPCGKAGKECDHGHDHGGVPGMQPSEIGDNNGPDEDEAIPPGDHNAGQPVVPPTVDPGMPLPDDSMPPPTEPVAIVTDPPPLPETPAPVPALVPIVKTEPPSSAIPTYAPTSIPTSTLQSLERGGKWFQSGRAYDIDEGVYARSRISELEHMAAVYDGEDADDAASGAPRTAVALVGLVAAGLAGFLLC